MSEHTFVSDHEHVAGDGCQTVTHGDHVDHLHGSDRHPEQPVHQGHEGQHSDGDGCATVAHGDHLDHLHDGHRHHQHGDHVDEH